MADAYVGVTDIANWIPELWADELLQQIQHETMLEDTTQRRYEKMLRFGDTVNMPRKSNPAVTSPSFGDAVSATYSEITEGVQTLTITVHDYSAMDIGDIAEFQSKYSVRESYHESMGYSLARTRDVAISTLYQNLSQVQGALGSPLNDSHLLDAWRQLASASTPKSPRYLPISPRALASLMQIDKFINQLYMGTTGQMLKDGVPIRQIYGAQVMETNLLRVPSTGQAEAAMYHKDQFALAVQGMPDTILHHDPTTLSWKMIVHQFYGTAEINRAPETLGGGTAVDTWGVLLRTHG